MAKRDLFHHNVPEDSVFERRLMADTFTQHIWQYFESVKNGHLELSPWYQRGLVWTLEQKQALIDTMVSGLNLPPFYFREMPTGSKHWLEVVDGKQRLTTLIEFAADGFRFRGKLFSEWSDDDRERYRGAYIGVCHLKYSTDEEIVKIYNRLNFNGTPHVEGQQAAIENCPSPITSWPQEKSPLEAFVPRDRCPACYSDGITFGCSCREEDIQAAILRKDPPRAQ